MNRKTHQSPRQRGYGSTSSLRNDSLKHTQKHEKGREELNQEAKLTGSGGPSGQEGRTVRPGGADRPHWPRGLSGLLPRTARANTADRRAYSADRPLNHTEPTEAHHEPRTVRGEHADCPTGIRGPSALSCGPSETPSNRNSKSRRIETKGEQEHEEHGTNWSGADRPPGPRGPSARCGQSRKHPTPKVNSPKSSSDFPNG
jgi:hypothetical protein